MKLKIISFLITTALAISMTSCAGKNSQSSENKQTEVSSEQAETSVAENFSSDNDETSYPIVIKHAFGETVIESKPQRIATIAWAAHDIPLALGVVPVGFSETVYGVSDGSGMLPWAASRLKELGGENPVLFKDTDGLDYEAISDANPDIILATSSGITQEEYDLLSKIAPVVAYPNLPWQTPWRTQIMLDATGMGMKSEGEKLVEDIENLINEKLSGYPQLKNKTIAFFYFIVNDLSKFYVYLPADVRVAYLEDLGMKMPESIKKIAETNNSFYAEISAENADILQDVDIILAYGSKDLLKALQSDALMGTIPAVQRGSVAIIEDNTPFAAAATPTPLSIPASIDEFLEIIAEAADKVQ